jgi:hypothetical protein
VTKLLYVEHNDDNLYCSRRGLSCLAFEFDCSPSL